MSYTAKKCEIKLFKYHHFIKLYQLLYVDLSYNQIYALYPNTFKDAPNLKYLLLNDNRLKIISKPLDLSTYNLLYLDLDDNRIESFSSDAFDLFPDLKNISLSNNKLEILPNGSLTKNPNLEMIWFRGNPLKELNSTVFDNKKNLKYVDFEGSICIDGFYYSKKILEMKKIIDRKCTKDSKVADNAIADTFIPFHSHSLFKDIHLKVY